jgi:hypothetical protein
MVQQLKPTRKRILKKGKLVWKALHNNRDQHSSTTKTLTNENTIHFGKPNKVF